MILRSLYLVLPLLACMAGCSGDSTTGVVRGTITVDGQPAEKGSIMFSPLDGASPTAGGDIVEGTYQAVVPLGHSEVVIRIPKVVGERKAYNTADSPMRPIIKEVLPPKYNDQTELQVEVVPGETECNFDLSSR